MPLYQSSAHFSKQVVNNIAVIAGECRRYMCRRLPQAICSQIHSFAGNHAGSQALIIDLRCCCCFQVILEGSRSTAEIWRQIQQVTVSNSLWINFDLLRICKMNLIKLKRRKICSFSKHFGKAYDTVFYRNQWCAETPSAGGRGILTN